MLIHQLLTILVFITSLSITVGQEIEKCYLLESGIEIESPDYEEEFQEFNSDKEKDALILFTPGYNKLIYISNIDDSKITVRKYENGVKISENILFKKNSNYDLFNNNQLRNLMVIGIEKTHPTQSVILLYKANGKLISSSRIFNINTAVECLNSTDLNKVLPLIELIKEIKRL